MIANMIFRAIVWLLSVALLCVIAVTLAAAVLPVAIFGGLLFIGIKGVL